MIFTKFESKHSTLSFFFHSHSILVYIHGNQLWLLYSFGNAWRMFDAHLYVFVWVLNFFPSFLKWGLCTFELILWVFYLFTFPLFYRNVYFNGYFNLRWNSVINSTVLIKNYDLSNVIFPLKRTSIRWHTSFATFIRSW